MKTDPVERLKMCDSRLCVIAILIFATLYVFSADADADAVLEEQARVQEMLLELDPSTVTSKDIHRRAIEIEENYKRYHQVYGVTWPAWRRHPAEPIPTNYHSGGDSAIFTGYYLAAATYRALVTQSLEDLEQVRATLGGLHLLTHVSGTPGVLARCAFPADQPEQFNFPERWTIRLERGVVYTNDGTVPDILNAGQTYPQMTFFTRTTRDQLSGVLFGLAVVWAELKQERFPNESPFVDAVAECRAIARVVSDALWYRLKSRDFEIRDHTDKSGTNSRRVNGLLRLQLAALRRATTRDGGEADKAEADKFYRLAWRRTFMFGRFGSWREWLYRLNNLDDYYAWNLRFARAYSVWLLEDNDKHRRVMVRYVRRKLWEHVKSHENTYFTFVYNAMSGKRDRMDEAVFALKGLSRRPQRMWASPLAGRDFRPGWFKLLFRDVSEDIVPVHLRNPAQYFQWEKDPFDTGGDLVGAYQTGPGLGVLLPYWLGRYHELIE